VGSRTAGCWCSTIWAILYFLCRVLLGGPEDFGTHSKHECEQGTWPLGGQRFLVVGGCVVQASSRRMGSAAGHSSLVTHISLEAFGPIVGEVDFDLVKPVVDVGRSAVFRTINRV
jgi:hypothetical protein